jgi:hypothetical protein
MAVLTGQRTTLNVASVQRAVDVHKPILLLEPDSAPLTVFLNNIYNGGRRRATINPEFSWVNDKSLARFDAINNGAGYASGATSLVVDNGDIFAVGDLVKVPRTGELLYVTAVATNTLTVTRGAGTTAAAALNDNDVLLVVGVADEEGALSKSARIVNPTKVTNYTEIKKRSIESSNTWLSSSNQTSPDDWTHQAKKASIEHNKDKEYSFLFGEPKETTGPNGKPLRYTGGLDYFLTQNRQSAPNPVTEADFSAFLRKVFRYGSKRKVMFASSLLISVLNQFAAGKLNTFVGAQSYGVEVSEWISPFGRLTLVNHPLLESATPSGTTGGYGERGYVVDFNGDDVAYRYLDGDGPGGSRDSRVYPNRQEPDRDGRKDELIGECGLMAGEPEKHGVYYNVIA